jgi:aryl-alcohol dehydrogenase-like predicted oxidoreductase
MPHFDVRITPLEEITRGLEDLVKAGKILYAGLDTLNIFFWYVYSSLELRSIVLVHYFGVPCCAKTT